MGMQSTLVDLSVSGHSSMCLSELKKQGPTTTVHTQLGFRCFSDVDRIDWSECRCLIGAGRGLQVGLRGVKPEWHRCRIRDSGPRAFEVPDHVEWVRRIVLPCCLRDFDGRRQGLGCLGIPTASGGALGWAILAGNFTPRMDGWMGYPLPVEHWDYAPSCWGKRGGWLIDD